MRRPIEHLNLLAALLGVGLLLGGPAPSAGAETSVNDLESALKKALGSDRPEERARAFDTIKDCADVRCVDLVLKGVKTVRAQQENVRKEQLTIEEAYEKQFNKKLKADEWFRNSTRSSKELDRYNKAVRKITQKLDILKVKQKTLENDFTRSRAQLDGAVQALRRVLEGVPSDQLVQGLDRIEGAWLQSKRADDRMRWLDTLADLDRPTVGPRLFKVVNDAALDVRLRAAALQSLADRKDAAAFDTAIAQLKPGASWEMTAAGVDALRRLHELRCVEPLIEFLTREELKRLREDAHLALKSLTGQEHGPYHEPWKRWWEDNWDRFEMPKAPSRGTDNDAPRDGVTFYGIHTFSDRILFVVDVSGSMDQTPKAKEGQPAPKPKIDVARTELLGAIDNLNNGDLFNVIFFNHEVVPWQAKMMKAAESTKRRAKEWIREQPPLGATNIYDALELAFGIALRSTGDDRLVDTIFFLTDGRPTAGKVQDPERILEEVLGWQKSAQVRIHTVGIGDHDEELLKALADHTGGTYVRRK